MFIREIDLGNNEVIQNWRYLFSQQCDIPLGGNSISAKNKMITNMYGFVVVGNVSMRLS